MALGRDKLTPVFNFPLSERVRMGRGQARRHAPPVVVEEGRHSNVLLLPVEKTKTETETKMFYYYNCTVIVSEQRRMNNLPAPPGRAGLNPYWMGPRRTRGCSPARDIRAASGPCHPHPAPVAPSPGTSPAGTPYRASRRTLPSHPIGALSFSSIDP